MSVLDEFRLDGEAALVTGAAGGIGGAFAEAMAEAGANVALADIDEEGLEATADRLRTNTDAEVLTITADVSEQAATERMVEETVETFGGLDIAFANAGIARLGVGWRCHVSANQQTSKALLSISPRKRRRTPPAKSCSWTAV